MYVEWLRLIIQLFVNSATSGAKSNNALELLKVVISALGPVVAALIIGIAGALITHRYASKREEAERAAVNDRHTKDLDAIQKRHDLDKESEWRAHAVELTKLEFERNLEAWKQDVNPDKEKLRPVILDFLAVYRDLKELDAATPKDLYKKISAVRINKRAPEESIPAPPKSTESPDEAGDAVVVANEPDPTPQSRPETPAPQPPSALTPEEQGGGPGVQSGSLTTTATGDAGDAEQSTEQKEQDSK